MHSNRYRLNTLWGRKFEISMQDCRKDSPVKIKAAEFPFVLEVVSNIAAQGKIAQGRVLGKPFGA
jgi:hypothetical protein